MQEMPFQKFICPNCGHEVQSRHWEVACIKLDCNWCEMVPQPAPMTMRPTKESSQFFSAALVTIGAMVALFFVFSYIYKAYLWWLS